MNNKIYRSIIEYISHRLSGRTLLGGESNKINENLAELFERNTNLEPNLFSNHLLFDNVLVTKELHIQR